MLINASHTHSGPPGVPARSGVALGSTPTAYAGYAAALPDLVAGAVTNHVHTTPAHLLDSQNADHVDDLVDVVLVGTRKRSEVPAETSDL